MDDRVPGGSMSPRAIVWRCECGETGISLKVPKVCPAEKEGVPGPHKIRVER